MYYISKFRFLYHRILQKGIRNYLRSFCWWGLNRYRMRWRFLNNYCIYNDTANIHLKCLHYSIFLYKDSDFRQNPLWNENKQYNLQKKFHKKDRNDDKLYNQFQIHNVCLNTNKKVSIFCYLSTYILKIKRMMYINITIFIFFYGYLYKYQKNFDIYYIDFHKFDNFIMGCCDIHHCRYITSYQIQFLLFFVLKRIRYRLYKQKVRNRIRNRLRNLYQNKLIFIPLDIQNSVNLEQLNLNKELS